MTQPRLSAHLRRMQFGYTAITVAAECKKWDLVPLLLDRKADPSIPAKVRLRGACLNCNANANNSSYRYAYTITLDHNPTPKP